MMFHVEHFAADVPFLHAGILLNDWGAPFTTGINVSTPILGSSPQIPAGLRYNPHRH